MKSKGILSLLIVLVLAAVAYYFYTQNANTTLETDERDFAVEDTASITRIFMADKNGREVLLDRNPEGGWILDETHAVRKDAIDMLLETMNRITVKAPVSKSMFNNVLKNMVNLGIKVEIYQGGDNPSKTYYVGTSNQNHTGTYMLLDGASKPFLMHIEGFYGFLGPRYIIRANDWRKNGLFNYPYGDIQQIEVSYRDEPQRGFRIEVGSTPEDLALYNSNDQPMPGFDSTEVRSFLALFQDINYEGFEETKTEAFIDSIKAATPYKVISVTDQAGETVRAELFRKPSPPGSMDFDGNTIENDLDRLYIWINRDLFVVGQYYVLDKISADLSAFRPKN